MKFKIVLFVIILFGCGSEPAQDQGPAVDWEQEPEPFRGWEQEPEPKRRSRSSSRGRSRSRSSSQSSNQSNSQSSSQTETQTETSDDKIFKSERQVCTDDYISALNKNCDVRLSPSDYFKCSLPYEIESKDCIYKSCLDNNQNRVGCERTKSQWESVIKRKKEEHGVSI